MVLQNDIDLLNPPAELEKRKHKLKRLVQSPNSFFMDVKCQGCFNITTVFSHSQTVVVCGNCQTVLCQPTGGKARLTEDITSPSVRENAVNVICYLAESEKCENWLVTENALPPLIRLLESESQVAKEKAVITLHRLSFSSATSRLIVGHGEVSSLIKIFKTGDSVFLKLLPLVL
ncbi:unnamed protein product [Eruca vesicaria subsp. sativa]|uniref:40S ribosomal protein S27 n=1 Tax=Eruca vesicaria subsp. sativa TaxID=29727 RepID=A0ABC8LJG9_ERUVS|nr:unnamed protein product [Eruca vesicaria subsp. sativa]